MITLEASHKGEFVKKIKKKSPQYIFASSVQLLSHVRLFVTPGLQHARLPRPSQPPRVYSNSCPLMPSNHLILCHHLLLLPSIFHSIRVFSNESVLRIRWPKYWRFSFSISSSNEYSGLIFF